jgi:hypothetical protein
MNLATTQPISCYTNVTSYERPNGLRDPEYYVGCEKGRGQLIKPYYYWRNIYLTVAAQRAHVPEFPTF